MAAPGPFTPDFELIVAQGADASGPAIEVHGELDSGTSGQLVSAVEAAVAAGPEALTLDLRQMTFIDSAGTRALIVIERLADERGITLNVTPAPDQVTELLRTAGVVERGAAGAAAGAPSAGAFVERTELELPRDPHSPARARAEVRDCVPGEGRPDGVANLVLLTSELVTNAVVHPRAVGETPIALRVTVYADRVRVEVEDAGEGFERSPQVMPEGERGRGLFLVDRFSDRWGSGRVETDAGPRFRVWFELGWPARETGVAA